MAAGPDASCFQGAAWSHPGSDSPPFQHFQSVGGQFDLKHRSCAKRKPPPGVHFRKQGRRRLGYFQHELREVPEKERLAHRGVEKVWLTDELFGLPDLDVFGSQTKNGGRPSEVAFGKLDRSSRVAQRLAWAFHRKHVHLSNELRHETR